MVCADVLSDQSLINMMLLYFREELGGRKNNYSYPVVNFFDERSHRKDFKTGERFFSHSRESKFFAKYGHFRDPKR